MLKTFRALKASSDFRRHHLPFLRTLEDQDLLREIGFNEAAGHPLSLKQFKRVLKLTLTSYARKLYVRWARDIRKNWK